MMLVIHLCMDSLCCSFFSENPIDSSCDCNDECTGDFVSCNPQSNTCACEPGYIKSSEAPFVCEPGNVKCY